MEARQRNNMSQVAESGKVTVDSAGTLNKMQGFW